MDDHSLENSGLIGSWKLDTFELELPDGTISYPYGEKLTGYIFYTAEGYMSTAFMSAGRAGDGGEDLAKAGAASTYDQFMAYSGSYEVTGDKVSHYVDVSSLEVWIGSTQERWYKLDGDRLTLLTTPLSVAGEAPVGRLTWTRL